MENNINEIGWTIKTTRNESSGEVNHNGIFRDCRIVEHIIAPDGSKIKMVQLISNVDEYHDIRIEKSK